MSSLFQTGHPNDASKMILEKFKNLCGNANYNGSMTEIVAYCPNCETKRYKTRAKGHFYISTESFLFSCKKCPFSGHISSLFEILGVDGSNPEINEMFGRIQSRPTFKQKKVEVTGNDTAPNLNKKLEYLKSRLLYNQQIEEIPNLVMNVVETAEKNGKVFNNPDNRKDLMENYIGFVFQRGSGIICRRIINDNKKRFQNVSFGKIEGKDFYRIHIDDPFNYEIPKVCICEGIFDALNIWKNPNLKEYLDGVCCIAACCGTGYKNTSVSVARHLYTGAISLNIFGDNDEDPDKKRTVFENYKSTAFLSFVENMRVHWNTLEKDWSYTSDRINVNWADYKTNKKLNWEIFGKWRKK